jgi:hypothetical protein
VRNKARLVAQGYS